MLGIKEIALVRILKPASVWSQSLAAAQNVVGAIYSDGTVFLGVVEAIVLGRGCDPFAFAKHENISIGDGHFCNAVYSSERIDIFTLASGDNGVVISLYKIKDFFSVALPAVAAGKGEQEANNDHYT